jgi:DnaJ like chaperone protein
MSIWSRIGEALSALAAGEGLAAVFDRLRAPPERSVAFTIAVIALGAKMAKADGRVTRNEVTAFREVFDSPAADEAAAARVFNLARQDVAGFEDYARRIRTMFGEGDGALSDLLEGLFHIALADGSFHPAEDEFLSRVAAIFGLPDRLYARIRARFVDDAESDPYDVLGVAPDMSLDAIRREWRRQVRETHPDALVGRGVPPEALKLAERRMIDLNRAWERISEEHAARQDS